MAESRTHRWQQEHKRLWGALVPPRGQAATLQGELVRIAGKLTDQAYRNGNCNWDADHERMWRFLGRHLDDPGVFDAKARAEIADAVERVIRDNDRPDVDSATSPYDLLSERTVEWCLARPDPVPHAADPSLCR